jgi:three-Cys-motif partner protein
MVLDDDSDEKWVYREHTAAKHEVYRKYLEPWINKLTHFNEVRGDYNKIRIVDCFAGRGSYVRAEECDGVKLQHIDTPADLPGSPQIILDKATYRSDEFETAECVFIEYNKNNFDILEENINRTDGIANNIEFDCIHGAFQEEILDIVEATDGTDCPTLFFIDPFGFKSLDYDVITEIGSTPQFEFLITFMQRDMNRFLTVDFHEDALETVFGTPKFRDEIDNFEPENWEAMIEYYTNRLEENGSQYTFEYLITEPDTRQTVYYLVFGSNHPNGLKVMREVMNTCGTGGFGYAPKDPNYDRNQSGLSGFLGGIEGTKQFLMDNFQDYRIEFLNLGLY